MRSSARRNGRYLALTSASSSAREIARLLVDRVRCGRALLMIAIARGVGGYILREVARREVVLRNERILVMEVDERMPKMETPL